MGYFVSDVINNNAVKNVAIFVLKVSRVDKNIPGIKGTRVIKVVHSLQRSLKLYPAAENIEVIEIDKEVINHKPAWIIDDDKIKYWAILGLDAVLSQTKDGKRNVLAYVSRTLRPSERNVKSSLMLELFGLKWALTKKFRSYLLGSQAEVYTDSMNLGFRRHAKLEAFEQRC